MSSLKQEWDSSQGSLKRLCKVCQKEFTPQKWNQILCEDPFCKQGSFLHSHFLASLKRWESWLNEAKGKSYPLDHLITDLNISPKGGD